MFEGKHHEEKSRGIALEIVNKYGSPMDKEGEFKLLRWKGWRIGAVRLGHSGPSSMLQLSGPVAASFAQPLGQYSGRPTRLDVQMTIQLLHSQPLFGRRWLRPSTPKGTRPKLPPRKIGEWRDSSGSFLGTVGDRTSPRYVRVYDKGVEAKTAEKGVLWRVELETKGKLAPKMFQQLTQAEDVQQWCYDSLRGQWKCLGLRWPLPEHSAAPDGLSVPTEAAPDAQRMALWLMTSVRPAIERMQRVYSRQQLQMMLGLENDNEPAPASTAHLS